MKAMVDKFEDVYGAASTYAAAATNAGIGAWMGENWFLVLSAIAVVIRMAVDLKKLLKDDNDDG